MCGLGDLVIMQLMALCCGLLIVWTLIDRLDDVYRDIVGIVYLLDVLVVVVHISHSKCWITYRCGGWKFLVTEFFSQKHLPGVLKRKKNWGGGEAKKFFLPTKLNKNNVPGILKHMHKILFGGGGGFWGVWGAPRPHPGVARGRKTIHFFLWPWHVTGLNSGAVRHGGQKSSSGNLGGGRKKYIILTKPQGIPGGKPGMPY